MIIEQTQKNQDYMKKILMDSGRISIPSKRDQHQTNDQMAMLSSHRMGSSRRESKLLDMIYEPNQATKEAAALKEQ